MTDLLRDLKHACRALAHDSGFSIPVVAALTVGIASNVAVFTILYAVLLKPFPFRDPDRIVTFIITTPTGSGPQASPVKFNIWRQQSEVFENVSAFRRGFVQLTGDGSSEQITVGRVSVDFFRLFGVSVAQGRTFIPQEDRRGSGPVVVLGNGFWRQRFGGDAHVIGRSISLNGQPHQVIGVIGPEFDQEDFNPSGRPSPFGQPQAWVPFQLDPNSSDHGHYFTVMARLKDGVSLRRARDRLSVLADDFRRQFPEVSGPHDGFTIDNFAKASVGDMRLPLILLMGAVGFVLLIACANVANLIAVRATVRQGEFAIRAALGASRRRIAGHLLMESVVLSIISCFGALAIGFAMVRLMLSLNLTQFARIGNRTLNPIPDWPVIVFAIALSAITAALFSVIPVIGLSRGELNSRFQAKQRGSGVNPRQSKLRAGLIVTETALALIVLVASALLIRTFVALRSVDPGLEMGNVVTMRMSLSDLRFQKTAGVGQMVRDATDAVAALPGVRAASASCCLPLDRMLNLPFIIEGRPLTGPSHGSGTWATISPNYFEVFQVPLIRGRTFSDSDNGSAPLVAIINQAMARELWGTADPLTDRLVIGRGVGPEFDEGPRQIVGIVGDVRDVGLNREPQSTMYVPIAQLSDRLNALTNAVMPLNWFVRFKSQSDNSLRPIETALRRVSGGLPLTNVRRMTEVRAQSTASGDFNTLVMAVFASAALLLAAIGVYGVMSYAVQQRTREMGIRQALGAESGQLRNMVVFDGLRVWVLGLLVGIAGALGVTRLLENMLFGVTATDPLVFLGVPVFMTIVALCRVVVAGASC